MSNFYDLPRDEQRRQLGRCIRSLAQKRGGVLVGPATTEYDKKRPAGWPAHEGAARIVLGSRKRTRWADALESLGLVPPKAYEQEERWNRPPEELFFEPEEWTPERLTRVQGYRDLGVEC